MHHAILRLLLISSALWYLGEGMLGPFIAIFTEKIGGSILDISSMWATYLIVYGILSIIFGRIADRYNKKKIMVAGFALNALFTFAYLFVETQTALLMVQAGLGIAAAMATPTWDALFDEFSLKKEGGTAWGISGAVASIFTGIAVIVGGFIITAWGFNGLFITMGSIQVIATFYQARILFPRRENPRS